MSREYIAQRIKWIISSYTGVEPEDVEEEMYLSDFHLDKTDVILLFEKIADEFEEEPSSLGNDPENIPVKDIIDTMFDME